MFELSQFKLNVYNVDDDCVKRKKADVQEDTEFIRLIM